MGDVLVSPSKINMYLKCPMMCYYYTQRVPQKRVGALEYGIKVHQVIAKYYEIIPRNITVERIERFLRRAMKLVKFDGSDSTEMDNFIKFEKWRVTNKHGYPIAVEKEFTKGDLHGRIDCLLEIEDKRTVIDWKTGYRYKKINSDMARQGLIYKYITDADEVIFIFLTGDNIVWAEASSSIDMLGISMDEIYEVVDSIRKGDFHIQEGEHCSMCLYNIRCNLDRRGWNLWDIPMW